VSREAFEHDSVLRSRRRRPRRHEYIHRGQFQTVHPERFADQAPQAVSSNRIAGRTRADSHAKTGKARVILRTLHDEQGIGVTIAAPSRALELGGGVELVAGPQSEAPGRKSLVSGVR
jgi:hypothetical protein